MLIGMLHHRKDPRKFAKAYAYAAVAKAEGAELLYFSPGSINYDRKSIDGFIYENGDWQQVTAPFPGVVYNTGSPEKMAHSRALLAKLQKEIPFTTFSIGHKMAVYKRLKYSSAFSKYLIPSEPVHSRKELLNFLELYGRIVFKPVNGHKGQDVFLIERDGDGFHLQAGCEHTICDLHGLYSFVREKTKKEQFLMQPFVGRKTKSGCCYDFRLHVQKNGEGKWVITAIYPRIGAPGSIITNISSGGSTNYLIPFLKQEFGDEYYNVKRYLERFALQLAHQLDQIQQERFAETLDELGIDVGLDEAGKICIYEINWRPGCPPSFYLELDVVRNMIRYALYLASQHRST